MEVIENKNNWAVLASLGDMNANTTKVLETLDRGDADTAKILQGTDQQGNTMTFVVIKNYR